jgi:hypothetical protein
LIFLVGAYDNANFCNRVARAINRYYGENQALVYTAWVNPYYYPEDKADLRIMEQLTADDWLIWTGDGDYQWFLNRALPRAGKDAKRAVFHTGTGFRLNTKEFTSRDTQIGARIRFVSPDLLRLCDSGPPAVPSIAPFEVPGVTIDRPLEVTACHSPSNPQRKGTPDIVDACKDMLPLEVIQKTSFENCLARRAKHQIFIDQLTPEIGAFSQSSIEAMAQGLAVITDIRHCDLAWEYIARPPVIQIETASELTESLRALLNNPDKLHTTRSNCLTWARENASDRVVADYYMGYLARYE